MNQKTWTAVDEYLTARLIPADPALEAALRESDASGLPPIQVPPLLGMFLNLLVRIHGARRILEIGTLGAYSTIWLGQALPADGRLITLELEEKHARVARKNILRSGLEHAVEVRVGPAEESMRAMVARGEAPFDFVFIDADKPNNPVYLELALQLSRKGTVIVGDNVVRGGDVADESSDDPSVRGSRQLIDMLAAEPRVRATALQTVGEKGYDGFVLAVVV